MNPMQPDPLDVRLRSSLDAVASAGAAQAAGARVVAAIGGRSPRKLREDAVVRQIRAAAAAAALLLAGLFAYGSGAPRAPAPAGRGEQILSVVTYDDGELEARPRDRIVTDILEMEVPE